MDETRIQFLASIGHPISEELGVLQQRFDAAKTRARSERKTKFIVKVEKLSREAINVFMQQKRRGDWTPICITRGGRLTELEFA